MKSFHYMGVGQYKGLRALRDKKRKEFIGHQIGNAEGYR
jgi:hypothetical protein